MPVITTSIVQSIKSAIASEGKAAAKTDAAIQKAVDAHIAACTVRKEEYLKGNARTNSARAEVKELFDGLFPEQPKTSAQYQSCFWLAFTTGAVFSRSALNKKSAEKKKSAKTEQAQDAGGKGADQNKVAIPKMTQGQLIELVTMECSKSAHFGARLIKALADIGLIEE